MNLSNYTFPHDTEVLAPIKFGNRFLHGIDEDEAKAFVSEWKEGPKKWIDLSEVPTRAQNLYHFGGN